MIKQSKNIINTLVNLARKTPKTAGKVMSEAGITPEMYAQYIQPTRKGVKFKQPKEWNDIARGPVTSNTPASERQAVTDRAINYANSEQFQDVLQRGLPQVKALGLQPRKFTNILDGMDPDLLPAFSSVGTGAFLRDKVPNVFQGTLSSYYPAKDNTKFLFTPHFVEDVTKYPMYQKAMAGDSDAIRQFGKINWPAAENRTPKQLPQHADLVDLQNNQQIQSMIKDIFQRNRMQRNYYKKNSSDPIATQESAFYETVLPKGTQASLKDLYLLSTTPFKHSQSLSNILREDKGNVLYKGGINFFLPTKGTDSMWLTPNPAVAAGYASGGYIPLLHSTKGDILGRVYAGNLKDVAPEAYKKVQSVAVADEAVGMNHDFFQNTNSILRNVGRGYERNGPLYGKFIPGSTLTQAERTAQDRVNYLRKKYPDLLQNKGDALNDMDYKLRNDGYPAGTTVSDILRPILNGAKFNKL